MVAFGPDGSVALFSVRGQLHDVEGRISNGLVLRGGNYLELRIAADFVAVRDSLSSAKLPDSLHYQRSEDFDIVLVGRRSDKPHGVRVVGPRGRADMRMSRRSDRIPLVQMLNQLGWRTTRALS